MRKIVVSEFVSLDGVMQAPGGKDEDTEGGFAHGGWTWPYWDDEIGGYIGQTMSESDALLLGRKTWQIHGGAFEPIPDGDPNDFGLNAMPKEDAVARDRLRHLTMAVAVLAVAVGFVAQPAGWLDRLKLVGVMIGLPAAAVVAARLVRGDWPPLLEGGDWPALVDEWRGAIQAGTWEAGAWCWSFPWLAGGLVAVGVWRTLARGRKHMPVLETSSSEGAGTPAALYRETAASRMSSREMTRLLARKGHARPPRAFAALPVTQDSIQTGWQGGGG